MKRILIIAITSLITCSSVYADAAVEIEGLTQRETRKITRAAKSQRANKTNLASVCKKVSNLSGLLVKTTAGGHIPRSDPRYSGFSIICAGSCVPFPAKVYHCNGSEAFKMGYYGRWSGNGKSRGYCGWAGAPQCPTSSVRARSKATKCSGAGYLAQGGGRCLRFNLNVDRNGGV